MTKGGKFTEKNGKRTAWNNYVSLLFKGNKGIKIQKIAQLWGLEKYDENENTAEKVVKDGKLTSDEIKKLIEKYYKQYEKKIVKKASSEVVKNVIKPIEKDYRKELVNKYTIPFDVINNYLFNYRRGQKILEGYNELFNAMFAYSFYPTPLETCNKLYNEINHFYGNDLELIDIGSGIGSLSMPFIKSGNYKKITMIEMNPDFAKYLKYYKRIDENIKVIENDIFTIKSDKIKGNVIVMNPPFEGNLYLKFILKALDIGYSNKNRWSAPYDLYVICPNTNFKNGNFIFPKKLVHEFVKDNNVVNKKLFTSEDENAYSQVQDEGEVKGFMKLSKRGTPEPLKLSGIHLFHFFI